MRRAVAQAIEGVLGLRQFEICTPFAMPRAGQLGQLSALGGEPSGGDPARAVLEPIGGNGPQKLVTEFAGRRSPQATSRWR